MAEENKFFRLLAPDGLNTPLEEMKKNRKKLALIYHPDKEGTQQDGMDLNAAYAELLVQLTPAAEPVVVLPPSPPPPKPKELGDGWVLEGVRFDPQATQRLTVQLMLTVNESKQISDSLFEFRCLVAHRQVRQEFPDARVLFTGIFTERHAPTFAKASVSFLVGDNYSSAWLTSNLPSKLRATPPTEQEMKDVARFEAEKMALAREVDIDGVLVKPRYKYYQFKL
jgi:hypothetical protein